MSGETRFKIVPLEETMRSFKMEETNGPNWYRSKFKNHAMVDIASRRMNNVKDQDDIPIKFKRPEPKQLVEEGYSCVDMHFHTNHSDSPTTIKAAIHKAKRKGIGVAITDHNQVSGSLEAAAMDSGVLLIPGIEVSASDGPHVLIYFYSVQDMRSYYERHIRSRKRKSPSLATTLSTEAIIDSTEGYSCLTVAAHPYGYLLFNKGLMKCIEGRWLKSELRERFDGLEVICGGMTRSLNVKAGRTAIDSGMSFTGGTDGHLLMDLGGVLTCARSDSVDGFLGSIADRTNLVIGLEKSLPEKCAMGTVVAGKYIRYLIPSLRIHYEQNAPRLARFVRELSDRDEN